jgi:hypothetical protein
MSNANVKVAWQYDSRGRTTQATYSNITGLSGATRTFSFAYDNADRVTSITYPSATGISAETLS